MKRADILKLMDDGYSDEEIDTKLAEERTREQRKQTKRQDRQQRRKKKAREESQ